LKRCIGLLWGWLRDPYMRAPISQAGLGKSAWGQSACAVRAGRLLPTTQQPAGSSWPAAASLANWRLLGTG
jgi:hypothetical protein